MRKRFENLTMRHPSVDDAPATLDLMIACDIAEYGEPDSSLEDLLHDWSLVELNQDAWLILTLDRQLIGYGAVFTDDDAYSFDFYTYPDYEDGKLQADLLAQCEARIYDDLAVDQGKGEGKTTSIISQVNTANRHVLERAGYLPQKYYFRMQIDLEDMPTSAVWPADCALRPMVAKQDDAIVYNFIQAAFDQPGRTAPTFERWRDFMMRPDHFERDLWFLLFHQQELIGAALCYDYEEFGWVRQLGVAPKWRRKGVGSSLLQHSFQVFFQQGHKSIALAVDSERPKAQSLYENVGMTCVRRHDEYTKIMRASAR
ncbi:MAG: GNAT family N-acetyltransferase [Anaerolineae bacterium]|nr:GNAT family N-acetyltransferase [Anaerolineae bacterium]